MSSAIYVTYDQYQPAPTGYSIYASAQYGDDGPLNGPDPEVCVGNGDTGLYGRDTWDNANYESNGSFDSGWDPVQLNVGQSGAQWSVSGADPGTLDYTGQACGTITGVELVAGVQTTGTAEFGQVMIQFLRGGNVVDSWSGEGPAAASSDPDSPFSEQDLIVRPSVDDADSVIVRGNVRLAAPAGVYPNPDDLFTGVFVNTTAGGPTS